MERRNFLRNGFFTGAAALTGTSILTSNRLDAAGSNAEKTNYHPTSVKADPFRMKFSGEFGIFSEAAGKNLTDQIRWGYDQGFRAWENTSLKFKTTQQQEEISKAIQQLGMEFGQFVGTMTFKDVTFAGSDTSLREEVLKDVRQSVEIAKRMNTRFVHNVLGMNDPRLSYDFQMANAVDLLRRIADIYEPHGIIMVMESMNHKVNHPGMFLHTIPQAYALAKAVNSPSIKILFDFYHVQIEEGNLLDTLDYAYNEIAYYQLADVPGRKEPTTGEINFKNALQHLHTKGYRGFVGLEHGTKNPGAEGAMAALSAYRSIDPR